MNKNTSIMAAAIAVAGILTLAVMTMPLQHHAFAQECPNGGYPIGGNCVNPNCDPPQQSTGGTTSDPPKSQSLAGDPPKQSTGGDGNTHAAIGGGGECMSGGAGGAGGEGGQNGTNLVKDTDKNADVYQDANGGKSNGGYGGNANGGDGLIR